MERQSSEPGNINRDNLPAPSVCSFTTADMELIEYMWESIRPMSDMPYAHRILMKTYQRQYIPYRT